VNLFGFVGNDGINTVDTHGLRPSLWTFNGINNWDGSRYVDYVSDGLKKHWRRKPKTDWHGESHAGTGYKYFVCDGKYVGVPWSESVLDSEARKYTNQCCKRASYCGSKFKILMISPKTDTRPPPGGGCCNIEIVTYWNPYDGVPNQGLGNHDSEAYWREWGAVHTVNTGIGIKDGHSFDRYFGENPILEGVIDPMVFPKGYVPAGKNAPNPTTYLDKWSRDGSVDVIAVCHSQGCNILMHFLGEICQKKK
jgi:hypothetical protein